MGARTAIEWTDATWNPIHGTRAYWTCVKISPGCTHCYAERLTMRRFGLDYRAGNDNRPVLHEPTLTAPLAWKRPRRIFVCSMTDLFEERVPDDWIDQIHGVMALARHHTFQVLTKRADRLAAWWCARKPSGPVRWMPGAPDLSNVWYGVSVENAAYYARIAALRNVPAKVRFLSLEPLLGPMPDLPLDGIRWVIVDGESGGPHERRLVRPFSEDGVHTRYIPKPEPLEWVRSLRDQCQAAGVPFFFKAWGGPTAKSGGRALDGRTWEEFPP